MQQYQRIALARDENIRIRAMFFCLKAARKEIDRGVKMTRLYKNIWQLTRYSTLSYFKLCAVSFYSHGS